MLPCGFPFGLSGSKGPLTFSPQHSLPRCAVYSQGKTADMHACASIPPALLAFCSLLAACISSGQVGELAAWGERAAQAARGDVKVGGS